MLERRSAHRHRRCVEGEIVLDDPASTLECLVNDLSEHGARLFLRSTVGVPGRFELVLPSRGESHRVRLVWRTDTQVGVEFLPKVEAGPRRARDQLGPVLSRG